MKKQRKKKLPKNYGFLMSGILFIGDPAYMAASLSNGIPEDDPLNPFKNFDKFLGQVSQSPTETLNLPLEMIQDVPGGRGVAIQTHVPSGVYSVKKKVCKKTGKLLEIRIVMPSND